ncbi:hypothetical protein B0H10DRAFT_2106451, partial [Mycena sp. CBHHK59/15]
MLGVERLTIFFLPPGRCLLSRLSVSCASPQIGAHSSCLPLGNLITPLSPESCPQIPAQIQQSTPFPSGPSHVLRIETIFCHVLRRKIRVRHVL